MTKSFDDWDRFNTTTLISLVYCYDDNSYVTIFIAIIMHNQLVCLPELLQSIIWMNDFYKNYKKGFRNL